MKCHFRYRHGGLSLTLNGWASRLGIDPAILRHRLAEGWSVRAMLTRPVVAEEIRSHRTAHRKRKATKAYEWRGLKMSVAEWARHLGIPESTIRQRLRLGYDFAQAIGRKRPPIAKHADGRPAIRLFTHGIKTLNARQWARRLDITPSTFWWRYHAGWPDEKLFAPNINKMRSEQKRLKKLTPRRRQTEFRAGLKHVAGILLYAPTLER